MSTEPLPSIVTGKQTHTPNAARAHHCDMTLSDMPCRELKIAKVRDMIALGSYETEERLDYAIDQLAYELGLE